MSDQTAPDTHTQAPAQKEPQTPAEIEADIEAQREHLADTVDQLAHKLDVKGQAKQRAAVLKDRATTDSGRPRPVLLVVGAGSVLAVGFLVWWRRR